MIYKYTYIYIHTYIQPYLKNTPKLSKVNNDHYIVTIFYIPIKFTLNNIMLKI